MNSPDHGLMADHDLCPECRWPNNECACSPDEPSTPAALPRAALVRRPALPALPRWARVNPWRVAWLTLRLIGSFAWWWGPSIAWFGFLGTYWHTIHKPDNVVALTVLGGGASFLWLFVNFMAASERAGKGPWGETVEEVWEDLADAWKSLERKAREP